MSYIMIELKFFREQKNLYLYRTQSANIRGNKIIDQLTHSKSGPGGG